MKILLLAFALLFATPGLSIADAPSREELVDKVEALYLPTSTFSATSPVTDRLLDSAAKANPNVDDVTWQSVKTETATAMTKLLMGKGSLVDTQFRDAVESLSDKELAAIGHIFGDPVYRKFQAAMTSNASTKKILAGGMTVGLQMIAAINAILASHHLNEVH